MVVHKPHHIFFVFFFGDRTGTEDQNAARLHILCCLVQNVSLEDHQFFLFLCSRTIFDLWFLTDHTVAGTWYICKYDICLALRFHIEHCRILHMCLYIDGVGAVDIFLDQFNLIPADISCIHGSKAFHLVSQMNALTARCRTHVDDIITFLRVCDLGNKHGAYILCHDLTLDKCIQCKNVVIIRNPECIRKIRRRFYLYTLVSEAFAGLLYRIQICTAAYSDWFFFQKIRQHLLCDFLAIIIQPAQNKWFRHGISDRKITDQIYLS